MLGLKSDQIGFESMESLASQIGIGRALSGIETLLLPEKHQDCPESFLQVQWNCNR